MHSYYMGSILSTAQNIVDNNNKKIVKPNILQLTKATINNYMGPEWNMYLVKK